MEIDAGGRLVRFIVCRSENGPYDDDTFSAGWRFGILHGALATPPGPDAVTVHVRCFEVKQADLVAMAAGYVIQSDTPLAIEAQPEFGSAQNSRHSGWHELVIVRATPVDDGLASPPGGPIPFGDSSL